MLVTEKKNFDLYMDCLKVRKDRIDSTLPIAHPLVGRSLLNTETGKIYIVEKAVKHWLWGYYIALLIQNQGSHALIRWENISSSENDILHDVAKNQKRYLVV